MMTNGDSEGQVFLPYPHRIMDYFLAHQNCLVNCGRGLCEEYSCEFILNLNQGFRSCFLFLALVANLFGGGEPLGQFW